MKKQIKQHYKTLAFVALLAFAAVAVAFAMPTERVWALKVDCASIQEQTLDGTVTITKVDENGAYLAGAKVTITKETWTGAKDADGNPLPEYGSPEVYTEEIPEGGIVLTPRDEDTSDDPSQIKIAALNFGDITDIRASTLITTSNETKRKGRITIEETQAPEGYEKLTDPIVFEYEWEIGPLDEYFNVYSVPNAQEYTDEAGKRRVYDYEGCDYPLKIIEKTQASADGEKVQYSEQQGQRRNDHFYEIQITNPAKPGNLTIEKKTVDNKQGTFPFTITAWKGEITATYKKIADLTFSFDGLYAQFTSKVSIQGINPLYEIDYGIGSNDTFEFDEDLVPIGNEDLWDLGLALYDHFDNQDDGYSEIWDIAIAGTTYPVHIYLDDFQTNSQGEEYVFGFYLEDNEISASIDELDSSSTGLTSRTIGDVYYVDFSKQGLSPVAADPHTYEFNLANGADKTLQIPHGYEYAITEGETDGWVLDSVEASGGAAASETGASGTIDVRSAETPKVVFTNKKKAEEQQTGTLAVSKVVKGNAADTNKAFNFTVALKDADDTPLANTELGNGVTTDAEGKITFTLKNGDSATISSIPAGTIYEVTEAEANQDGYATTSNDATGTIAAGETATAAFTNTRNATGKLTIEKKLAGNATSTDDEFEFTITLGDASFSETVSGVAFTNGVATVKLKGNESKTIDGLPNKATYTVEETDSNGYASSNTGNTGTIDENNEAKVSFTNTKNTYGDLVVTKAVAGNAADAQKDFSFTVELKTDGAPLANTAVGTDTTDESGKIAFTLAHNQSKTITGIPNGTSYTVTEADYTSDGYVTTKSDDTGTIAGGVDSSTTAVFTNTRNAPGSLTIAKNIEGNAASEDDEFTFTITLDDDTISNTYSGVEFKAGVATIKLKGGDTKLIEGLPNGVGWTVAEDDYSADGYTTSVGGADGRSASGTIDENAPATAAFTNTKNTYGQLVVTKAVAGNAADAQKDFSFTVELKTGDAPLANTALGSDTTDANGKITFTLKHNGSKTITGIPNGTSYVVTEADYTSDGYVTTKSGDTGTIAGGAGSSVTAAFTNTRNAPGSLTIAKNISGNAASEDDKFTFTITLDDDTIAGTYSDVGFTGGVATITLKGGTTKLIEGLPNGVGYTVKETDKAGYVNDADELSGTIDENAPATASFTNVKNIQTPTILTLGDPPVTVQKKLSGDKPSEPETFVFVMAPDDASYPLQEGAKDGRMEVSIVGEGEIEFGIITFVEPGIYRYTVYEVAGSTDGYTYDDTVYNVVYTVTEGNDGALSCDRQIVKGDETVNECVFTNNYKETKTPSDPKPEDPPSNPEPEDPPSDPEPEDPRDPEDIPKPEPPSDNPEPEDPSDPEDNPTDEPEDPEDTPSPKPSTPEDNPKDKPSVPIDTPKGKSGGDSPKTGGSAPQTGDSNNLGLFGSILAVSLSVFLLAGYKSRKRND